MGGTEQREEAIALRDTFGQVAKDISSKAGEFHDITADAASQGAHALADTDSEFGGKFNDLGNDPVQPATPKPTDPTADPSGGETPSHGSVNDDFGSGNNGDPLREQTPVKSRSSCPTDPVDPATGEMVLEQNDVLLSGLLDLVLDRVHISGYGRGRLFGRSWASSLDQRLQVDTDGIHYCAPDGVVLHYPEPATHGQKVLPSAGARWPLTWDRRADRIVIEQTELGTFLDFPPGPLPDQLRPLAAVVDRNGNRVTFIVDADGVPTDVYHSGGYHVRVSSVDTRDGIRVSALHLVDQYGGADELLREFRYDMAGRLVAVVDSTEIPHCFEYDAEDRITAWVNRIGYRYSYEYDAVAGSCAPAAKTARWQGGSATTTRHAQRRSPLPSAR